MKFCVGKVLETGVGTSRNLDYYPKHIELLGIDWSRNVLEVALTKTTDKLNFDYKIADVENMPFQDN